MKTNSKTKWQISKELTEHCKQLLKHNSNKINGYSIENSIIINKNNGMKVNLLEDSKFSVEVHDDTFEEKDLIKLADKIRSHIISKYPEFYKKLDELKASDSQVTLSSKAQKIIYQIAFNIDRIPELKDEIITIGHLLQEEKDIYEHYGF